MLTRKIISLKREIEGVCSDCYLGGDLGPGLEVAWVKFEGLREEVEYLSVYSSDLGNMEYDDSLETFLTTNDRGESVWSLVIPSVTPRHLGFYQCQVREGSN